MFENIDFVQITILPYRHWPMIVRLEDYKPLQVREDTLAPDCPLCAEALDKNRDHLESCLNNG